MKKAELAAGFAMATPDDETIVDRKSEQHNATQSSSAKATGNAKGFPSLASGSDWLRGMLGARTAGA